MRTPFRNKTIDRPCFYGIQTCIIETLKIHYLRVRNTWGALGNSPRYVRKCVFKFLPRPPKDAPSAANPMLPTLCFQPDASNPTRWWQLAVREHPSRTLGRVNDQSFLIMPMPSLHLMRWLFGVVDAHQVAICSVFCKSVFCSIVLYLCRMFCCIL